MENNKPYFCAAPWVHVHTWPDGRVFPCRNSFRESINFGNLNQNTLEEIWNSDEYKLFREDLLNGKPRPDVCARCYENEKLGHWSLRNYINQNFYDEFKKQISYSETPLKLSYWDFRFDNLCNQACRACGPSLSSAWIEDYKKLRKIEIPVKFIRYGTKEKRQALYDSQFENLKEINFAGGESTITEDHYYILKKINESNKNDISLRYVTNLSVLKFKELNFIDVWKKLKKVEIMVSLDEIGPRGEYWRYGLDWKKFLDNLICLKDAVRNHTHMQMLYGVTVTTFNACRLDQIVKFLFDNDLIDSTIDIDFNPTICGTNYLDITTFDEKYKILCKNSCEQAQELLNTINKDDRILPVLEKLKTNYSFRIADGDDYVLLRKAAAIEYARLDKIRNQSLQLIAPEVYEFYKNYGYDEEYTKFNPNG